MFKRFGLFGRQRLRRSRRHACVDFADTGSGEGNVVDITRVKSGTSVRVVEVIGPEGLVNRLRTMGIIPGTVIVKKGSSAMKGPVVIEWNRVKIAIGFRMAQMIIVEPAVEGNMDRGQNYD